MADKDNKIMQDLTKVLAGINDTLKGKVSAKVDTDAIKREANERSLENAATLAKAKQMELKKKLEESPKVKYTANVMLKDMFGKVYSFQWNCLLFSIEFGKTVEIPSILRDKFEEKLNKISASSVNENIDTKLN